MLLFRRLAVSVTLVALLLPGLVCAQDEPGPRPGTPLPFFSFKNASTGLPYTSNRLEKGRPVVVMFFEPSCEHCQQQAEWIAASAERFVKMGVQFVYVSTEGPEDMLAFGRSFFEGSGLEPVFLQDENYLFDGLFTYSPVPSMYLYNTEHQLVTSHKGEEVPAADIAQALR